MKKQFGVLNPKKLDYALALSLCLMAISMLWVGIWIAVSKTQFFAVDVLSLLLKALAFDLSGASYLQVLLLSVVFYGGAIFSVCSICIMIVKKRYRAIPGMVALLVASVLLSTEIAFMLNYANFAVSGVSGVFAILLGIMIIAVAILTYKAALCSFKMLCCKKAYDGYISEDKEEQVKVEYKAEPKEEAKVEVKKDEPKKQEVKKVTPKKVEIKEVVEEPEENLKLSIKANHYTFEQKLKMAKPIARKYFKELTAYFTSLEFRPDLTKAGEIFTYKNVKYAHITTAGKSGLKIYFKLDPKKYENLTIPFKDVSDKKKYEKTPLLFTVKSDLAVRRAKSLMDYIRVSLENENK